MRITPVNMYFIGVVVNLLYITILLCNPTSSANLQLPEGRYSENLWKQTDVLTYVYPARNFLHNGTIGYGSLPDYHRTTGYPLFLAGSIKLFGVYSLPVIFFLQALIFAGIYPALARIAAILFKDGQYSLMVPPFLFLLMFGTYIAMVPVVLTDLFFTAVFTFGLWCGLEAVLRKDWKYLLLHILLIGYAAQVRPLLSLYPLINLLLLMAVAKEHLTFRTTKIQLFLAVATVSLLVLCNAPSIRNYLNHGIVEPTDIVANNMFYYLAKDALTRNGEQSTYQLMKHRVDSVTVVPERVNLKEKLAITVFKKYPLTTLTQIFYNAASNLFEPHWLLTAGFFGLHYSDIKNGQHMPLRRSNLVLAIFGINVLLNIVVWIIFSFSLVYWLQSDRRLIIMPIIILIFYFLIPTFMAGQGGRMRLPAEGLIVLCSFYYLRRNLIAKNAGWCKNKEGQLFT